MQKSLLQLSIPKSLSRELDSYCESDYSFIFHTSPIQSFLQTSPSSQSSLTPENWFNTITLGLPNFINQYPHHAFLLALSSLDIFLQSTVTGPALTFDSFSLIFPRHFNPESSSSIISQSISSYLSVDGEAIYSLTPNTQYFALVKAILSHAQIFSSIGFLASWTKFRLDALNQRLLPRSTHLLKAKLFAQLDNLYHDPFLSDSSSLSQDLRTKVLIELKLEHIALLLYYRDFEKARSILHHVTQLRHFDFILTGKLGKRTRFQQSNFSQLIVLAKSTDTLPLDFQTSPPPVPDLVPFNDDTLLPRIHFQTDIPVSSSVLSSSFSTTCQIPASLQTLDPNNQPLLHPLDAIILLDYASCISAASPSIANDELSREELLPFVTRVTDCIEANSSNTSLNTWVNWQVYTQALLVRSRIDSFRSRTLERGLLQLVALRDQVVQQISSSCNSVSTTIPDTFLPASTTSEPAPAPAHARLCYVHCLASPFVWDVETELAERWVSVGGLKSALEIYERLQMWSEVALCWAATDNPEKARAVIRQHLFLPNDSHENFDKDINTMDKPFLYSGPLRNPLPAESPRLFCILGDVEQDVQWYEKAWELSYHRYARAQRSIGRYYYTRNNFARARDAFTLAVQIFGVDEKSFFWLGCCHLKLKAYCEAANAFKRAISLDDTDAESWANLATALLMQARNSDRSSSKDCTQLDKTDDDDPIKHEKCQEALHALKQAARLKQNDFRLWDNIITISVEVNPPNYWDIITGVRRIIEIRRSSEDDRIIPLGVLALVLKHIVNKYNPQHQESKRGLPRLFGELIDKFIVPLITSRAELWRFVAAYQQWCGDYQAALDSREKSWRCSINTKGWVDGQASVKAVSFADNLDDINNNGVDFRLSDDSSNLQKLSLTIVRQGGNDHKENSAVHRWRLIARETLSLVDDYMNLGAKVSVTSNPGNTSKQSTHDDPVKCTTWKFKARSALRSVLARTKSVWGSSPEYLELEQKLNELCKK